MNSQTSKPLKSSNSTAYYRTDLKEAKKRALQEKKSEPKSFKYAVCSIISFITVIIPVILLGLFLIGFTPAVGVLVCVSYMLGEIGYIILFLVSIIFGIIALNNKNKRKWSRILAIISMIINIFIIITVTMNIVRNH